MTVGLAPAASAATWQRSTVDPSQPGWYSSLAFDASDVPHVAYRDTSTSVCYAYETGTTWRGLGTTTGPDTVYPAPGAPGSSVGYVVSMALDPTGAPHVAYTVGNTIRYASWSGTGWTSVQTSSTGTAMFPSLAIAPDGTAYISYIACTSSSDTRNCGGTGGSVMLTRASNGSLTPPTTIQAASDTFSADSYTSLAVTSTGEPRVAYFNEKSGGQLVYASDGGDGLGTWTPETVPVPAGSGWNVSLALDDDQPRMAYTRGSAAYYVAKAGAWTESYVGPAAAGTASQTSLGLDQAGRPHLAYRRSGTDGTAYSRTRIVHSWWYGGHWTTEVVSDTTPPADLDNLWYPSLAVDSTGGVGVTYYVQLGGTSTSGPLAFAHLPRPVLTVTAQDQSIPYGAQPAEPGFTYSGFLPGDDATVVDTAPTCTVADGPYVPGEYPITCTGADDGRYSFEYVDGTLTVGKATLTVTAANQQITYGQQPAEPSYDYAGFITPDTAADIDTPPDCAIADGPYVPGDHTITCSGAADDDYDFAYVDGTLSVGKATLTVTAKDKTITYGQQPGDLTFTYDGFVPGDDASGIDTAPVCTVVPPYTPGVHAITCSGGQDDRYAFAFADGKLTVDKATLTVTAKDKTITYGQQPGDLTFTYDGFVPGDDASGIDTAPVCTVEEGPYVAGEYAISCSGGQDDWYDLAYVAGTLTVDKATLTVTAEDQTKTYGSPNPELTFGYGGFVGGEDASVLTQEPTCATAAVRLSSVAGSPYDITCSGGEDENYAFDYVTGELTVTPAEALVRYIGETVFVTSGSGSTTAQVTLTATLQAVDESYPLGVATVSFVDETTGRVLAAGVPVAPVVGQPNVGTANTVVTLSSGQYGAEAYVIQVVATGNYENGDQPDTDKTATVVVMKPALTNQTTGGGTFLPVAPAGTYAGAPGSDVTFSIGLVYNSKGTNLQGQVKLTIPQPDGSIVYVKSNAISSMKIVKSASVMTSTIYTKASVYRVDDGVVTSLDGNVTLRVDALDHTSGTTPDEVGFTVLSSKTSSLYYSNRWVLSGGVWKTITQPVAPLAIDIN